jgi:hypothetical protein
MCAIIGYLINMNKSKPALLIILFLVGVAFVQKSCVSHDFPTYVPCDNSVIVSFENDVRPIIQTKCAIEGCHNGGTTLPNWNDFSTFQDHARNGSVKNFVIHRIMPRAESTQGPLSQDQINTIACWIDQGAIDN